MSSKLPQDLISREQLLIIRFLQKIKKKTFVRAGAEAPSGYGKEKEGLVICFEDWVCKAFWRLGLPQPAQRGRATPYRRLAAAPRSWSGRRRDTGVFQVPPHA